MLYPALISMKIIKKRRSFKIYFNLGRLLLFSLLVLSTNSWGAGNQLNTTLTINTGMGVNNNANRNLTTNDAPGVACAGQNVGNCNGGPFADTSDPFQDNHDCSNSSTSSSVCASSFDSQLAGGFSLVDNRFGRGAPCGPNDSNGPPFPYPCHTQGSINQKVPLGLDDPNSTFSNSPPTLGAVGQPFYQFRSDTFGTLRVNHIEYGWDQNLNSAGNGGGAAQNTKVFYVIDSTTDGNGHMVGNATGTYKLIIADGTFANCSITAGNVASSGTFESGPTGVITCLDRGGNPCQSVQFMPGKFSVSGGFNCP